MSSTASSRSGSRSTCSAEGPHGVLAASVPMPFDLVRFAGTVLAAATAALHVRAEYRGPRWQVYLCKPITTALLLVLALLAQGPGARYQAAVAVGLTLSLFGDVFLMLPGDRFVAGLASFLLAHVAYLVAFTAGGAPGPAPRPSSPPPPPPPP